MSDVSPIGLLLDRMRQNVSRRALGAVAALAIEALLLLVLLSLGEIESPHKTVPLAVDSFDVKNETKPIPKPEKTPDRNAARQAAQTVPQPQPSPTPSEIASAPRSAVILPLSPQVQSFDLSKLAQAPARPAPLIGPVDTPRFGDSQRVGTAPNGQPMYAARWYREPTDQELRGYLSTAQAPAWGLITCKTVADFRVEDCVGLDQYPEGSRMLPAILAAAWQFRVRPPIIGGVPQVGDWVRIRIEYDFKPAANPYGGSRAP